MADGQPASRVSPDAADQTAIPPPWNQVRLNETPEGRLAIDIETLPETQSIFFPVFVIGKGIGVDAINFLLEKSFLPIEHTFLTKVEQYEELNGHLFERLVLPESRKPELELWPTEWPMFEDELELPFLGKSFSDVFAAWVGKDRATLVDRVAPFRLVSGVTDKPRWWSSKTFLVLDEKTMATPEEPTALVAFLDRDSSEESEVQFFRCDFPVSLTFMRSLEGGIFKPEICREHLVAEDGIVRMQTWRDWNKPGGRGEVVLGLIGLSDEEVQQKLGVETQYYRVGRRDKKPPPAAE